MRNIYAFQEDGVRWTYHVPKKAFRRVENLHHACMMTKKEKLSSSGIWKREGCVSPQFWMRKLKNEWVVEEGGGLKIYPV